MVTSVVGDRRSSPPCEDHEEQDPLQEPLPLEPTDFSVTDLYFWQVGELPLGCVLTFACPEVEEGAPEPRMVAVLVQSRELNDHGHGKQKKSKKKKRKKKKKKKDSDGSSSESSTSGSSSSPLKPPLQRKAERKPGSVLRLLMDHVRVALSDMSLLEGEGDGPAGAVTSSARVQSYFQILVRPHLQGRPRDEKELYSLAVAIDTLRGGDIQRLADMLAGRYLAVETAALEGSWETAKWLEVSRLDRGAASSDILLAARKHQRVIDRASGRGSFSRSYDQYWASGHGEWTDAPTGRGKGKHGKKGKGKGKKSKNSKKSQSDPWWTGGNPEKDQKDPEGTK